MPSTKYSLRTSPFRRHTGTLLRRSAPHLTLSHYLVPNSSSHIGHITPTSQTPNDMSNPLFYDPQTVTWTLKSPTNDLVAVAHLPHRWSLRFHLLINDRAFLLRRVRSNRYAVLECGPDADSRAEAEAREVGHVMESGVLRKQYDGAFDDELSEWLPPFVFWLVLMYSRRAGNDVGYCELPERVKSIKL
eukprot:GFKZ01001719.1.p1 GENE.GFKZ01001719.1~~GFKZ01001719.1.p1  ORF type:complete len:189 (+),score=17.64 GFKZ01001719.1:67-633(+)